MRHIDLSRIGSQAARSTPPGVRHRMATGPGVAGSAGVRSRMRCRFRWPAGPAGPAAGAGFHPSATGSGWLPAAARDPGDREPVPGTFITRQPGAAWRRSRLPVPGMARRGAQAFGSCRVSPYPWHRALGLNAANLTCGPGQEVPPGAEGAVGGGRPSTTGTFCSENAVKNTDECGKSEAESAISRFRGQVRRIAPALAGGLFPAGSPPARAGGAPRPPARLAGPDGNKSALGRRRSG